jgi:2-(1,2-epoxy-1,2-dihydrophenyl)acetyl-CoA isomerase
MRTDFQYLLIKQEEGVLTVTLNRPEVLNAFNDSMLHELIAAMDEAAQDETVRCVVLTGAGRAFGSGQDVSALASRPPTGADESGAISEHLKKYQHVVRTMRNMQKPTVAAIRGVAAGIACNIALACDLRIAADNARFLEAFARIGLVPDGGGGYLLPRLIGLGRALDMALLAEEVSGPEAERIGLVTKCVPLEEFDTAVAALARRLANGPTRTYGLIKELLYQSMEMPLQASFDLEGQLQNAARATEDHKEGVNAFLQKRPAKYTGK